MSNLSNESVPRSSAGASNNRQNFDVPFEDENVDNFNNSYRGKNNRGNRSSHQFRNNPNTRNFRNDNQQQQHSDFNYSKNNEKKFNHFNSSNNEEEMNEFGENYRNNSRGASGGGVHSRSWQKSRISNRNQGDADVEENQVSQNRSKKHDDKKRKTTTSDENNKKEESKELTFSRSSSLKLKNNRQHLLSVSSANGAISCICCLHELFTFVYYSCLHYVCLNCAVKMRVLCEKIDCPGKLKLKRT